MSGNPPSQPPKAQLLLGGGAEPAEDHAKRHRESLQQELSDLRRRYLVLSERYEVVFEALLAVLDEKPLKRHVVGRPRCEEWPHCRHACGDALAAAHRLVRIALLKAQEVLPSKALKTLLPGSDK